jgi:hypothetical protein
MAHLTINVPEDLVGDLRRQLRETHAECAAALRRSLNAYTDADGRLDDVEGALVELRDLDTALAALLDIPAGPATITAHPEVLADALAELLVARPDDPAIRELARIAARGSR